MEDICYTGSQGRKQRFVGIWKKIISVRKYLIKVNVNAPRQEKGSAMRSEWMGSCEDKSRMETVGPIRVF